MNVTDKRETLQNIAYGLIEFVIDENSRNSKHSDYKYEYANQISDHIGKVSDINIGTMYDAVFAALSDEDKRNSQYHHVMFQVYETLEVMGLDIDTSAKYEVLDFYEDYQQPHSELVDISWDIEIPEPSAPL